MDTCAPLDALNSHIYPFVEYSMYSEMMRNLNRPYLRRHFFKFLWFVSHNLDVTVCCKRVHNFYEGTLLRDDYGVDILYMWGERDMAYDVPYIKGLVAPKSDSDRERYHFIPRAGHGACFFGKRQDESVQRMVAWLGGEGAANC